MRRCSRPGPTTTRSMTLPPRTRPGRGIRSAWRDESSPAAWFATSRTCRSSSPWPGRQAELARAIHRRRTGQFRRGQGGCRGRATGADRRVPGRHADDPLRIEVSDEGEVACGNWDNLPCGWACSSAAMPSLIDLLGLVAWSPRPAQERAQRDHRLPALSDRRDGCRSGFCWCKANSRSATWRSTPPVHCRLSTSSRRCGRGRPARCCCGSGFRPASSCWPSRDPAWRRGAILRRGPGGGEPRRGVLLVWC